MDDPYADLVAASNPDALRESLAEHADDLKTAAGAHHAGPLAAVRNASYRGHKIVIRTTYEITVDGEPFESPLVVDNSGRVYYHGLPTRDFPSTVDLVKKVIDFFPEEFGGGGDGRPTPGPEAGAGHGGH